MTDLWKDLTGKLGNLVGKWTVYAAFGSFVLYLFGYLALRFQLSTYGVATNLDVFDEKYIFAGCRFFVYFVAAVPNILIIVLVLAAVGYLPYKLVPATFKGCLRHWASGWCAGPAHLPLLGVVFGIILVQFVLRKCLAFGNLLLAKQLPDRWLSSILLASDEQQSLYFSGLVAGTLLTAGILLYVLRCGTATTAVSQVLLIILVFLVAVEFLLLPVNYGVLISTRQLPRVSEMGEDDKGVEGQYDWVVWDSKDAITYFVCNSTDQRMLVTIPRKDSKVQIVSYDDILRKLFCRNHVVVQTRKP